MTKALKKKAVVAAIALFMAIAGIFVTTLSVESARAATDHSLCAQSGEYCLVCDVADKVNALPETEAITIDNAASVMQQINDIDRIKYDLTDGSTTS